MEKSKSKRKKKKDLNLFDMKPCNECPHSCVEGDPTKKCPYDSMFENEINQSREYKQKMFMDGFMGLIKDVNK